MCCETMSKIATREASLLQQQVVAFQNKKRDTKCLQLAFFSDSEPKMLNVSLLIVVDSSSSAMVLAAASAAAAVAHATYYASRRPLFSPPGSCDRCRCCRQARTEFTHEFRYQKRRTGTGASRVGTVWLSHGCPEASRHYLTCSLNEHDERLD